MVDERNRSGSDRVFWRNLQKPLKIWPETDFFRAKRPYFLIWPGLFRKMMPCGGQYCQSHKKRNKAREAIVSGRKQLCRLA
jgi:hypothetical protein